MVRSDRREGGLRGRGQTLLIMIWNTNASLRIMIQILEVAVQFRCSAIVVDGLQTIVSHNLTVVVGQVVPRAM